MQRGGAVLLGKVLPIVAAEAGVRRNGCSESDKVYYVHSNLNALFWTTSTVAHQTATLAPEAQARKLRIVTLWSPTEPVKLSVTDTVNDPP